MKTKAMQQSQKSRIVTIPRYKLPHCGESPDDYGSKFVGTGRGRTAEPHMFSKRGHRLLVTDGWAPLGTLHAFALTSRGSVVLHGIGVAFTLEHLLRNQSVTQITVVEGDPEVLKKIEPFVKSDPRVEVVRQFPRGFLDSTFGSSLGNNHVLIDFEKLADLCESDSPASQRVG